MTIGWETLNAYVDRELDAAEAAGVAAAIARDPSLAARVATIARLKAGAAALPAPGAPHLPQALGRRPLLRRGWTFAAAAACVTLIASGGAAWLMNRPPATDAVAATVATERDWLAGARPAGPSSGVRVAVAAGASESLPDLSPAELRLAYLAADPVADGRRGLFAGNVGPHGCRLGLWVGRAEGGGNAAPSSRSVGDVAVREWTEGAAAYALMSRGMDPARLDRFAAAVADLARAGHRLDDEIRIALRQAAATGAACTG